MNFQVTVLKILVSYPNGFASMPALKRDMAILATSGPDWAARTKRMGARVPELDLFTQQLVGRLNGGRRITDKGRAVLELMEPRPTANQVQPEDTRAPELSPQVPAVSLPVELRRREPERLGRRRCSRVTDG
ncbi:MULTISPECIES: hypothetical protein [unclassified Bradyrhizobium]|uniref:hypothetical protein n=1 Tax=unclassified Bradyrhizobium TaxID=2631580 RepID=UPI001FF7FDA3|nr:MULTISPECIES: hypothetical protein [unclassified Bradyrhizobium]